MWKGFSAFPFCKLCSNIEENGSLSAVISVHQPFFFFYSEDCNLQPQQTKVSQDRCCSKLSSRQERRSPLAHSRVCALVQGSFPSVQFLLGEERRNTLQCSVMSWGLQQAVQHGYSVHLTKGASALASSALDRRRCGCKRPHLRPGWQLAAVRCVPCC